MGGSRHWASLIWCRENVVNKKNCFQTIFTVGTLASLSYFTFVIFKNKFSKDSWAASLSLFKMANGFDFVTLLKTWREIISVVQLGILLWKVCFQVDKKKNDLLSLVEIVPWHFLKPNVKTITSALCSFRKIYHVFYHVPCLLAGVFFTLQMNSCVSLFLTTNNLHKQDGRLRKSSTGCQNLTSCRWNWVEIVFLC